MSFTAQDVKKLRDATSAGMLDCKNALKATDGDFEAAVDHLRKSGIAKAGKKADREANEGLAFALTEGTNKGALVLVSCETDFVAKNATFQAYVEEIATKALNTAGNGDVAATLNTAEDENLKAKIATIGENLKIPKAVSWESAGAVSSYIHAAGKVGVLVDVEGDYDEELLKGLGMHIAAFRPQYLSPEEVPAADLERERAIFLDKAAGKPAEIAEKIVNGSIAKWYNEVCLVKQGWIMDDKVAIEKKFPNLKINRFARFGAGTN